MKYLLKYIKLAVVWFICVAAAGFTFGFTFALLKSAAKLGASLI